MIANRKSPLAFFLLVYGLSLPFWLIGAATSLQLLPGLPVSSLMAFCPLMAALMLGHRENRAGGVTGMLRRSFDVRRIGPKVWYIPAILLMPLLAVLAYVVMRLLHRPLPVPNVPLLSAPFLFLLFFVAAMAEEVGWSGYVLDPLQDRWNALQAGILLGLAWAVWHIVPFVQADRTPAWIAWQCLTLVASRVLIVWLYNNTRQSVFVAALCHTMINVSWQLFPNQGSHYDPRIAGPVTALAAAAVMVIWGPRTLVQTPSG
jgi:hypothetical protein